jgi:hypothetical protein
VPGFAGNVRETIWTLALQDKRAFFFTLPPMLLATSKRVNTFPQQLHLAGEQQLSLSA